MTGNHNYRRDVRGRFTRVPVEAAYADQSRFPTVARDGLDVGFQGSDPDQLAYGTEQRYAPTGDLAQSGQRLRARRPELVHPDDEDHTIYGKQGAVLRTAARHSGPLDPSPYLVGLTRGTPTAVLLVADDGR